MKDISILINKLTGLEAYVNLQAGLFFEQNSKIVEGMQRGQMLDNINNEGQSMGDYAPKTIEIKKKKGTYSGNKVIIKDSGNLQKGLKCTIDGMTVYLDSPVSYFEKMVDSDFKPIGLDPQNMLLLEKRFIEFLNTKLELYFN